MIVKAIKLKLSHTGSFLAQRRIINGVLGAIPVIAFNSTVFYITGSTWTDDEVVFAGWMVVLLSCLDGRYPRCTPREDIVLVGRLCTSVILLTARWAVLRLVLYPLYGWTVVWASGVVLRSVDAPPSEWSRWSPLLAMFPASFCYLTCDQSPRCDVLKGEQWSCCADKSYSSVRECNSGTSKKLPNKVDKVNIGNNHSYNSNSIVNN